MDQEEIVGDTSIDTDAHLESYRAHHLLRRESVCTLSFVSEAVYRPSVQDQRKETQMKAAQGAGDEDPTG